MWVCFQSTYCPGRSRPCISRGSLTELGIWNKAKSRVKKAIEDPQKMGAGGQRRLPQVFCYNTRKVTKELVLGDLAERRFVGSLPGLLACVACHLTGSFCWNLS